MSALGVLPALAAQQEYLLVGNYTSENILRYDLTTGAFVDELVSAGTGGLGNPRGMTIGPDGALYVVSFTDGPPETRVLRFNAHTGEYLGTFTAADGTGSLIDLAFGPDGNLYVSDAFNKVYRFDGSTGASMGVFASVDAPDNQFRDIAWGPDGNLYVAQLWTGTVIRFDGYTGAQIGVLGSAETSWAESLACGPDGLLYVSEYFSGGPTLDVYNPITGAFVKSLESPYLNGPNSVVFDDEGTLYVNSLFSNTIVKFTGDLGTLFAEGSPLGNPNDMVITITGPDAELTVTKAYLRFAQGVEAEDQETEEAVDDGAGPQDAGEGADALRVRGTMDLADESDGIDPLTEKVTFSAGIHTVEIPEGSFHWWPKAEAYGYAGDYNGGRVWILLKEPSGYDDTWEYRAGFKGVDNSGTSNPITVKLTVGDDSGETEVDLFGILRYVAP